MIADDVDDKRQKTIGQGRCLQDLMKCLTLLSDKNLTRIVRSSMKHVAEPDKKEVHVLIFNDVAQIEGVLENPEKLRKVQYLKSSLDDVPEQNRASVHAMANTINWQKEFLLVISSIHPANVTVQRVEF